MPSASHRLATQVGHLGRRAGLVGEGQPVALLAYDGLASVPAFHPLHGKFREDAVTSRSFAVLSSVTSSGMVNHLRRPWIILELT